MVSHLEWISEPVDTACIEPELFRASDLECENLGSGRLYYACGAQHYAEQRSESVHGCVRLRQIRDSVKAGEEATEITSLQPGLGFFDVERRDIESENVETAVDQLNGIRARTRSDLGHRKLVELPGGFVRSTAVKEL